MERHQHRVKQKVEEKSECDGTMRTWLFFGVQTLLKNTSYSAKLALSTRSMSSSLVATAGSELRGSRLTWHRVGPISSRHDVEDNVGRNSAPKENHCLGNCVQHGCTVKRSTRMGRENFLNATIGHDAVKGAELVKKDKGKSFNEEADPTVHSDQESGIDKRRKRAQFEPNGIYNNWVTAGKYLKQVKPKQEESFFTQELEQGGFRQYKETILRRLIKQFNEVLAADMDLDGSNFESELDLDLWSEDVDDPEASWEGIISLFDDMDVGLDVIELPL
ncbi:hypothetical protein TorRG33x02_270780 [Trema orientale]|uniref:Uncharacterized protein n=1 Tax=Trema orientale TaxID=63057 RepID=A0A2P5CWR8_TREOI|nr:hypothetical protein TorRG33x02_270780 [Trema orientale]